MKLWGRLLLAIVLFSSTILFNRGVWAESHVPISAPIDHYQFELSSVLEQIDLLQMHRYLQNPRANRSWKMGGYLRTYLANRMGFATRLDDVRWARPIEINHHLYYFFGMFDLDNQFRVHYMPVAPKPQDRTIPFESIDAGQSRIEVRSFHNQVVVIIANRTEIYEMIGTEQNGGFQFSPPMPIFRSDAGYVWLGMAQGHDTLYMALRNPNDWTLLISHQDHLGSAWSVPTVLSTSASDSVDLMAHGDQVYVGWSDRRFEHVVERGHQWIDPIMGDDQRLMLSVSSNAGQTFSKPVLVGDRRDPREIVEHIFLAMDETSVVAFSRRSDSVPTAWHRCRLSASLKDQQMLAPVSEEDLNQAYEKRLSEQWAGLVPDLSGDTSAPVRAWEKTGIDLNLPGNLDGHCIPFKEFPANVLRSSDYDGAAIFADVPVDFCRQKPGCEIHTKRDLASTWGQDIDGYPDSTNFAIADCGKHPPRPQIMESSLPTDCAERTELPKRLSEILPSQPGLTGLEIQQGASATYCRSKADCRLLTTKRFEALWGADLMDKSSTDLFGLIRCPSRQDRQAEGKNALDAWEASADVLDSSMTLVLNERMGTWCGKPTANSEYGGSQIRLLVYKKGEKILARATTAWPVPPGGRLGIKGYVDHLFLIPMPTSNARVLLSFSEISNYGMAHEWQWNSANNVLHSGHEMFYMSRSCDGYWQENPPWAGEVNLL